MTQLASSARRAGREPEPRHHRVSRPATGSQPRRGRHATPHGDGFGFLVGWTILGTVVPGTGLLAAGRRLAGGAALAVVGGIALAGVAAAVYAKSRGLADVALTLVRIGFSPSTLLYVAAAILLLAMLWVFVVVGTHLSLREDTTLSTGQSLLGGVLVMALVGAVAVPAAGASRLVMVQRDLVQTVFAGGAGAKKTDPDSTKVDPWAGIPRVNILMLGGDDGHDRMGVRPDTVILASIDTRTGDTLIFSIPRQLQRAPFPEGSEGHNAWPLGFGPAVGRAPTDAECSPEIGACYFYSIWRTAEEHKDYFPGDPNPGLTATKQAVEGVLGLHVDYYGKVNLKGFSDFVDAIGGLRLNVRRDLPIGGGTNQLTGRTNPITGWVKKGENRLLGGYDALWFARSRHMSDNWERMARQQCVIGALAEQVDPMEVALAYPKIAKSAKSNITTDIPYQQMDAWVDLAKRVKSAQVRSVVLDHDVFGSDARPDFDAIQRVVRRAIDNPPPPVTSTPTPGASPSTSPSTSPTTTTTTTTRTTTRPGTPLDVAEVC